MNENEVTMNEYDLIRKYYINKIKTDKVIIFIYLRMQHYIVLTKINKNLPLYSLTPS
jgi:hypothetical protein